jgi:hypothetical protein
VLAPASPPPTEPSDSAAESVQTGVAVIGANFHDSPRSSRARWMASAGALLVLVAGVAWALTGRNTSGSHSSAASDPKPFATTTAAAPLEPPAPPPAPAIQEPEVPEPAAPAPAPTAAEPALPDDTNAAAGTEIAPDESAPRPTLAPEPAPATAPASPSNKPCGKFLKRCK